MAVQTINKDNCYVDNVDINKILLDINTAIHGKNPSHMLWILIIDGKQLRHHIPVIVHSSLEPSVPGSRLCHAHTPLTADTLLQLRNFSSSSSGQGATISHPIDRGQLFMPCSLSHVQAFGQILHAYFFAYCYWLFLSCSSFTQSLQLNDPNKQVTAKKLCCIYHVSAAVLIKNQNCIFHWIIHAERERPACIALQSLTSQ